MSWRRTTIGGAVAITLLVLVVGGFMTLRAFGIGPAGSLFGKGSLSASDRILIADFRAPAADSALGGVIAETLRLSLAQSRAIGVVSAAGIADGLRRMQRPSDANLDLALARELAEREGVKAVVHGEVASAGTGFIITARLIAAASGVELASFRAAARDATDIIPAVDHLTRDLRAKIGESLKSVRDAPPLVQVTTTSLPALRKYTEGMMLHYRQAQYGKAAVAFEEAVRLDSTFGMAYMRASGSYYNAATNVARRDTMRERAFRMRDRLPPLERALVEAQHYVDEGRRDSAVAASERALAMDASQAYVLNLLGLSYRAQREPARAESAFRKAIALNNGSAQAAVNLVAALVDQGKIVEAKIQIAEALRLYPAYSSTPLNSSAGIALAEGRYDSAEKLLRLSAQSERSNIALSAVRHLSSMKVMRGHLSAALRMGDSLFARDEAAENVSNAAARRVGITLDSIHQENWTRERHADAAQRLDVLVAAQRAGGGLSPSALLTVAREYAWAGQSEKARSMLDRFDREVHDSVALRNQYSARLWTDGEVALAERRYPDALAKFRAADRMYDGKPHACPECTEVILARAFDLGGMADSAIAAFERYLSRSASNRFAIDADYLAGSYKRLGELYEAKGDNQKAATYYGKFVELWKDADPELQPRVTEVRKRLARLNVQESKR